MEEAPSSSVGAPVAVPESDARLLEAHRIPIPAHLDPAAATDAHGGGGFFYLADFLTPEEELHVAQKVLTAPQPKWKVLQNRRLQYWGGQLTTPRSASGTADGDGRGGGSSSAQPVQALIPEPLPDWLVGFPNLIQRVRATGAFQGSKHGEPNHCLVNEYQPGQGIMPHEDGGAYYPCTATISLGSHTLLDIYRYAETPGEAQQPSAKERESQGLETSLGSRESTGTTVGAREADDVARADVEVGERDGGRASSAGPRPRPPPPPHRPPSPAGRGASGGARAREKDPVFSILQEPRSLLVTRGHAYTTFLHGIAERDHDDAAALRRVVNVDSIADLELRRHVRLAKQPHPVPPSTPAPSEPAVTSTTAETATPSARLPRGPRISLTLRDVERVSKGLGAIFGRRQRGT